MIFFKFQKSGDIKILWDKNVTEILKHKISIFYIEINVFFLTTTTSINKKKIIV